MVNILAWDKLSVRLNMVVCCVPTRFSIRIYLLALTNPIDAGFTKFCETCGICAETCPVGAIPERGIDRNWDPFTGQKWSDDKQAGGTKVMYNIPGYKGWRTNLFACAFTPCACACKSNCPFNAIPDGSFVHSLVKSTVANTPLFNSFFANMEAVMHYGKQDRIPNHGGTALRNGLCTVLIPIWSNNRIKNRRELIWKILFLLS